MAIRLFSKFNLHGYTSTEISTRLVHIDVKAKYKCQNRTHSTYTFTPCMFELPPQAMVSPALCQCYVWDKLVAMSLDPYYCDFLAPKIASYAIAAPSHVGDGAGFYFKADLRIIIDVDHYPSAIPFPIPMDGDDSFIHHDIFGPIWMHDGDGGVIVLNEVKEDMPTVVRPRGASESVIDKLIMHGRLAADNDDVKEGTACPVCLEDFLPRKTTEAELLRMPCSHLFHHHCIVPWLERKDSCLMCQKSVAV